MISKSFTVSDLQPGLTTAHQVNNPCNLVYRGIFDAQSLYIHTFGPQTEYISVDYFTFNDALCPNGSEPDSAEGFNIDDVDMTLTLYYAKDPSGYNFNYVTMSENRIMTTSSNEFGVT